MRPVVGMGVAAAALGAATALALLAGPTPLHRLDAVVIGLRAPRALAALGVGAALALAGVVMQALLRNALADPYVLGMSGGASLGAVLAVLAGARHAPAPAAAAGALAAATLVGALGRERGGWVGPTRTLLAGFALAAVLSAATGFLVQVAPAGAGLRAALFWTAGSLAAAGWTGGAGSLALALAALLLLLRLAGWMDRLLLGDAAAETLGVPVSRARALLLAAACLLTGGAVAIAGPVGFVGLTAPHLARLLVGCRHARLLPAAALLGAALLLAADTASRTLLAPRELPVGILTALAGGPILLVLLRRGDYGFGEVA